MDTIRRRVLQALAGACALPAARGFAAPLFDKQISVVVGYPAGTADNTARKLAEKLRGAYASTLIVENKPGARGVPAANAVLAAPPDGSVLYVAPNALSTLWPLIYRGLPYDPVADFKPISTLGINELALAVGPNSPIANLGQYIDWARSAPDKALYGTLGVGSLPEFVGFAFAQAAGIRLTPVPYRGAAPGVIDLLGGRTASWLGPLGDVAIHAKSGQARILATAGAQRSKFTPDVPTFTELGFPAATFRDYWGVYVRADTPAPLAARINALIVDAVKSPDFVATLADLYLEAHASTPEEYAAIVERDRAALGKLVAASHFKPEGA